MPNKVAAVGNEGRTGEGYTCHWHVPIDDESHVRFDVRGSVTIGRLRQKLSSTAIAAISVTVICRIAKR
jgi:hypothetical protein